MRDALPERAGIWEGGAVREWREIWGTGRGGLAWRPRCGVIFAALA